MNVQLESMTLGLAQGRTLTLDEYNLMQDHLEAERLERAARIQTAAAVAVKKVVETIQPGIDDEWMQYGKCRKIPPETFFPSNGRDVEIARRICADCPVKSPCLEYALQNRIDHGIWGGASERERRRIAARRRLA